MKIDVAGIPVQVEYKPLDDSGGEWHQSDRRIVIDSKLPAEKRRAVLFHELCHAALDLPGLSELLNSKAEEAIVIALENILLPAWDAAEAKQRKANGVSN